jgi:hypothetical protein
MEPTSFIGAIFGAVWIYAYWIVWGLTSVACAYFVYQSAIRRKQAALGIGAYWWAFFTLLGGIWTLLIYWLIEHSTLSSHRNDDAP